MNLILAKDINNAIIESLIDGNGIRLVVFCCGCKFRCVDCQNHAFQNPQNGIAYDIQYIFEYIKEMLQKGNYDGITFSGGDPMFQKDKVLQLIKLLREYDKDLNIWLYTGYTYENIQNEEILKYINTLVDGQYIKEKKSLNHKFRGSSNQRLIYLKNGKINYIK